MHLLGYLLPDHKLVRIALTKFYGISHATSARILARLQIHETALVSSLTEPQITALSAYLSSPSTTVAPAPTPICPPNLRLEEWTAQLAREAEGGGKLSSVQKGKGREDPLNDLRIETDLRRSVQADIAHHRAIGTYRGKRHSAGLPVRGQRTRNNGKTAKKLNRVERRGYASSSCIRVTEDSAPASIPRVLAARIHCPPANSWVEQFRTLFAERFREMRS